MLYSQIDDVETAINETRITMRVLSALARESHDDGPYAEFSKSPPAILILLSKKTSATPEDIARELKDGGFPTKAKDFTHVVRLALKRMSQRGEVILRPNGLWSLNRASPRNQEQTASTSPDAQSKVEKRASQIVELLRASPDTPMGATEIATALFGRKDTKQERINTVSLVKRPMKHLRDEGILVSAGDGKWRLIDDAV